MKYSGIGGQAVLEGVMMRNGDRYAVAVRTPEGTIEVRTHDIKNKRTGFLAWPFVRGVVSFVDSLVLGMSSLTESASYYEDEETAGLSKEEKEKQEKKENFFTILIAVVLAVGLFLLLPYGISRLLGRFISSESLLVLIEGVIRVALFIAYVAAISLMEDIKRTYMYHGAEHKCINCIEHGLPLTVDNVRASSRQHKRCGTSFLLIVCIISIFVFMLVRVPNPVIKLLSRIVLIPVIAGISYEFLSLAGRNDNPVIDVLSKPGLMLQKLTTAEPDDDMIEVGIASVEAVFDWKAFLAENFDMHFEETADVETEE